MTNSLNAVPSRSLSGRPLVALVTAVAIVLSVIVELVVAAFAHAAGSSSDFAPLTAAGLIPPTVLGLLIASVTWHLVRARAKNPQAVMRRMVPTVVLLSLVPDVQLGISKREAHTTWAEVLVLMVLHLLVSAIGVYLFHRTMPLNRRDDRSSPVERPEI
ncbi:DUF6069 family protein [Streptomyces sp. NPDC059627]